MIKDVKFAVEGIKKVFKKMEKERNNLNASSYHTLVNSLRDYMDILWFSINDDVSFIKNHEKYRDTYKDLLSIINNELRRLEEAINDSLEENKFKEHYKWLISYKKLKEEKRNIKHDYLLKVDASF